MKWRIVKATALLALLATLAIIHEQHDRTVSFSSIVNRFAARTQHGTYPSTIGRYHRLRSGGMGADDLSNNAPLLLCFIIGLPYLVFTIVLYIIEILDIGSDQDLRTLVGAARKCHFRLSFILFLLLPCSSATISSCSVLNRDADSDTDDDNETTDDATVAAASQPIGDAPVFMSAPQLSSMDLNEDATTESK